MTTRPLPADDTVPEKHRVVPPEHGLPAPPPDTSPPFDGLLIPVVHELVDQFVTAARDITGGSLPRLRSEEFLDAEPAVQLAVLLIAAEASVISDPHLVVRALMRQASHDVHGGDTSHWRRVGLHHTRNVELVAQRQAERARVADQPRSHDHAAPPDERRQDPAA